MPEDEYVWLAREALLSYEEIARLVDVFTALGADRLRLTGGEPLVRRDLPDLIAMLAGRPAVRDLALTTNGVLLAGSAEALKQAGLSRLTVSLDTLRPERFRRLAGRDALTQVLDGIEAARAAGIAPIKLNTVIVRGVNDDEIVALLEFGRRSEIEVRFIEYMDVGGATRWSADQVVPQSEILEHIARHFGRCTPLPAADRTAPAERFRLADGSVFGVIASTTAPFCGRCDRGRLTADGVWYTCLYARRGLSLRELLQGGADDRSIAAAIRAGWTARAERGAEQRLHMHNRGAFVPLEQLRADPHLEMHTRGG